MEKTQYKCSRCGKVYINKYKPIRLSKELYGYGRYNQYSTTGAKFYLCARCYTQFLKWLYKI